MYLAVMLAMLGFCLGYGTPWRWGALVALGVVLAIKVRALEEEAMAARHGLRRVRAIHEAHRSLHLVSHPPAGASSICPMAAATRRS